MLSVYQHWDPLKICAVGRSYEPEFYSFIENPKVRSVMERIAIETEEDYQKLIKLLESFNVQVVRTDISQNREDHFYDGWRYYPPPMCPRDYTLMLGNTFFMPGLNYSSRWINNHLVYTGLNLDYEIDLILSRNEDNNEEILNNLRKKISKYNPVVQKDILQKIKLMMRSINHDPLSTFPNNKIWDSFKSMRELVESHGNKIVEDTYANGANIIRIGKDIYHGEITENEPEEYLLRNIKEVHSHVEDDYRIYALESATHSDGVFTPVKPGLIVSLQKMSKYKKTFPDWEVVELPNEGWEKVDPFLKLKHKNAGKWWVPGEELNDDFTDFVETWLKDWVLYVEETVFDVNMLVIDEKNVVCNNYNKKVFDAFERHGVTPHIVNFRHRYFWDGGLHCITSDLHREGAMQDYFPERSKK
jgi:hypothetical protein